MTEENKLLQLAEESDIWSAAVPQHMDSVQYSKPQTIKTPKHNTKQTWIRHIQGC